METDQKSKIPRTFRTPRYLKILEKDTYGVFVDLVCETDRKDEAGNAIREKLRTIGPIQVLRPARLDEKENVVMRTVNPDTFQEIELVPLT